MIRNKAYYLLVAVFLIGCKSLQIKKELKSEFLENQFTGIYVYDLESEKVILNYNGDKYFTPASNTKIFTLFTGLSVLSDSIPAFKYAVNKDTIIIQGTGDPSFLHPFFKDSTALKMAKKYKKVKIITNNISDERYGPGWAWEDFGRYFSPERSAFPMYGNVVSIKNKKNGFNIPPKFFNKNLKITHKGYRREEFTNTFYYGKNRMREAKIPMIIDSNLTANLWNDLLPNKVELIRSSNLKLSKFAYSISADSLYTRMMKESDNFLAEQLLVLVSSTLSDTLNTSNARKFILENELKELNQKPRWVDGSGLSRYNLFTPNSFVHVLTKMYQKIPKERLFSFLSVGGESGRLKNWFFGKDNPYVYAKSGSLGNNYNLSGYLITDSGKVLAFSYMNNHFMSSSSKIKEKMQVVLEEIRVNF